MLLEQNVDIYVSKNNRKYFESKGYNCKKNGSKISVNVHDLKPYSREEVLIKCDFCGKIFKRKYNIYTKSEFKDLDACKECVPKKNKIIYNLKYGVDNISQLPETQQKIKENNLKKYGVESTSQLESVKQKTKETTLKRYGSEYYTQTQEYKDKCKKTCIDKYGTEYAISAPVNRAKIINTLQERYGVDNPSQIDSVMEKIISSKYIAGNQTSSKQQRQLCDYLNGELNYPFKRFFIDIAFPKEKVAIEYIGGGHDLSVKLGDITEKEFQRNENFRRKCLFDEGWKIIEFISLKNKITSKDISVNIYEFCVELFNTQNKHYIKVYIDEDKIMNSKGTICYKNTLNDWNEKTPLKDGDGTVCTGI